VVKLVLQLINSLDVCTKHQTKLSAPSTEYDYHMVHFAYLFLVVVAAPAAALVIADWSNSQLYDDE